MDHGFRIDIHESVEPYAKVVVSGPALHLADVRATIYGPKCGYARTLPTTFSPSFREHERVHFLVQDPCYWTPALPFLYELAVEWVTSTGELQQERCTFGLRRCEARRSSLYLEGKRFVLRGVHVESMTDENIEKARSAEVALIVPTPSRNDLERANRHGVAVVADIRRSSPGEGTGNGNYAALYPSELATIIDSSQVAEYGASEGGLIAVAIGPSDAFPELAPANRRHLIAVELDPGARPPAWVATCGRPVIAIHRGQTYADFQAARAACDELQAELAPAFDLAGYFV